MSLPISYVSVAEKRGRVGTSFCLLGGCVAAWIGLANMHFFLKIVMFEVIPSQINCLG